MKIFDKYQIYWNYYDKTHMTDQMTRLVEEANSFLFSVYI